MNKAAKQSFVLLLLAAAVCLLAWRLWPDSAQARRHQRDHALMKAVQANDLMSATRLLDEGADPNGHIPPFSVTWKARICYDFVSRGAKAPSWSGIDKMNSHCSLLEIAVIRCDGDMVSLLLSKGADAGYQDSGKMTALTWAKMPNGAVRPGGRNGADAPRILALLKAAAPQAHHTGNRP